MDQNALLAALQRERISAAGLDVFESEPLPADHPLRFLPNVVATPHIGGGSKEIEIKELEATMSNIERFLSGIRPERLINASILNEARARARDLADAPA